MVSAALISNTFFTVWHFSAHHKYAACSCGSWGRAMPFRPIVAERGGVAGVGAATGGSTGDDSSADGNKSRAAASASVTPRRWANARKDRLGHPPGMQRGPQHDEQDVNPLIGLALVHPEQPSLHHPEGVGFQVGQDKQQPIFRVGSGQLL